MATVFEYTDQKIHDLGLVWFATVVEPAPEPAATDKKTEHPPGKKQVAATAAKVEALPKAPTSDAPSSDRLIAGLTRRCYFRTIPGAPDDENTMEKQGKKLYRKFAEARGVRTDTSTGVAVGTGDRETCGAGLLEWMRENHGVAVAVQREPGGSSALAQLPLLGELASDSGLSESSDGLLKFFSTPAALAVLSSYGIDSAEVAKGQALRAQWAAAGVVVVGGRGQRDFATAGHIAARDQFAAWLNKWWSIAKALFPNPKDGGLLKMAGIETATIQPTLTKAEKLAKEKKAQEAKVAAEQEAAKAALDAKATEAQAAQAGGSESAPK